MKVFELAKLHGYDSKLVLDGLKIAGIPVKTPVSVIPPSMVEKAKELYPPTIKPTKVQDVIPAKVEVVKKEAYVDQLKNRQMAGIPAEGHETRFNQYLVGIRRQVIGGKVCNSLLTYVFDPDTLEVQLFSEKEKRNESEAIMDLKHQLVVRKII